MSAYNWETSQSWATETHKTKIVLEDCTIHGTIIINTTGMEFKGDENHPTIEKDSCLARVSMVHKNWLKQTVTVKSEQLGDVVTAKRWVRAQIRKMKGS